MYQIGSKHMANTGLFFPIMTNFPTQIQLEIFSPLYPTVKLLRISRLLTCIFVPGLTFGLPGSHRNYLTLPRTGNGVVTKNGQNKNL